MEKPKVSIEQRRARRQERREKQRIANVGRAAKMHLARIARTQEPQTKPTHRVVKSTGNPQPFVGCSGWFYWHWRESFYPAGSTTKEWFAHYASHFKTVELNAPFYSWPTPGTVQTWLRQASRRRFIYTVKVCELITHVKRFTGVKTLIRDFGFIADLLGPRMGCFLFQFPPSFQFTAARLKRIANQLDHSRKNVIEFRHRSWWNQDVYAAFAETGTIFCSCSGPRLPDELIKTADEIYVRFHGTKQ